MRRVYWSNTLEDLKQELRFKVAEKKLEAIQMYEAFAQVVSQALGGSKEDSKSVAKASVKKENQATTSAEAFAIFANAFGRN